MKRLPVLALATALACLAPQLPASAHPHVWIDVACALLFDADGRATGVSESWSFDEMYSSFAVTGLDGNRDGKLSRDELAGLTKIVLDASGGHDHFTAASLDGRQLTLSDAKDAWSEFGADGRLVVHFRLDFEAPQSLQSETLRIEVVDPELYADFRLLDPAASAAKTLPAGCTMALDDPAKSLPKDPDAVMKALIDGPLVTLKSALTARCERR